VIGSVPSVGCFQLSNSHSSSNFHVFPFLEKEPYHTIATTQVSHTNADTSFRCAGNSILRHCSAASTNADIQIVPIVRSPLSPGRRAVVPVTVVFALRAAVCALYDVKWITSLTVEVLKVVESSVVAIVAVSVIAGSDLFVQSRSKP
jgi:hypothetical protein